MSLSYPSIGPPVLGFNVKTPDMTTGGTNRSLFFENFKGQHST